MRGKKKEYRHANQTFENRSRRQREKKSGWDKVERWKHERLALQ